MDIDWSRAGFERLGFTGWVPFSGLTASEDLPAKRGVYAIATAPGARPVFLAESVGGPHKGRPLTVPVEALDAAWRNDAEIMYIGKADSVNGFRDRLWAYSRQGRGISASHYGGRYIWQLQGSASLLVAWKATPAFTSPGDVEDALLTVHVEQFGRRPFANLNGGRKMAPAEAHALLAKVFPA